MSDWKAEASRWLKTTYKQACDKSAERKAKFTTASGIVRSPLDGPTATPDSAYTECLGFPGEYPFTRGVQPTMYRGRFWTMRQYAGFASAKMSNERYHALLKTGQTGLSVAFDLPTQMGFDADSARASGEVGKVGVSICSLRDMQTLFKGIALDAVSTSMTINATATILLCFYAAVSEGQGIPMTALQGTVQNDILKEYIARGTYIFPPVSSLRLITNLIAFCNKKIPHWNPISISGYHIREAGSTAAQEIGFTLANGISYVDAVIKEGLRVDDFAKRLSFFFNVHNDFLEEIAKFRAARRLWARIMKERFAAQNPRSMMLRFHAQTAGSTLTAQQPLNNVVRVGLQAMAAALGGAQSLHTNSWDEALALPSQDAAQLALRTQQIIAHETGIADTIDAMGGSYHIERLTDELEAKAETYLKRIDNLGGMVRAIEEGYPQQEIQEAAYRAQRAVETGETAVVGVNMFQAEEQPVAELFHIDETVEAEQVERLKDLKKMRNNEAVRRTLDALKYGAASRDANLMPLIYEAVKTEASLEEVANALRSVFGEHQEHVVL